MAYEIIRQCPTARFCVCQFDIVAKKRLAQALACFQWRPDQSDVTQWIEWNASTFWLRYIYICIYFDSVFDWILTCVTDRRMPFLPFASLHQEGKLLWYDILIACILMLTILILVVSESIPFASYILILRILYLTPPKTNLLVHLKTRLVHLNITCLQRRIIWTLLFITVFHINLGGGFKYFFNVHPENWGRWTQFDDIIFFKGVGLTTNQ